MAFYQPFHCSPFCWGLLGHQNPHQQNGGQKGKTGTVFTIHQDPLGWFKFQNFTYFFIDLISVGIFEIDWPRALEMAKKAFFVFSGCLKHVSPWIILVWLHKLYNFQLKKSKIAKVYLASDFPSLHLTSSALYTCHHFLFSLSRETSWITKLRFNSPLNSWRKYLLSIPRVSHISHKMVTSRIADISGNWDGPLQHIFWCIRMSQCNE